MFSKMNLPVILTNLNYNRDDGKPTEALRIATAGPAATADVEMLVIAPPARPQYTCLSINAARLLAIFMALFAAVLVYAVASFPYCWLDDFKTVLDDGFRAVQTANVVSACLVATTTICLLRGVYGQQKSVFSLKVAIMLQGFLIGFTILGTLVNAGLLGWFKTPKLNRPTEYGSMSIGICFILSGCSSVPLAISVGLQTLAAFVMCGALHELSA